MSQNQAISLFEQLVTYALVRARCYALPVDLNRLAEHLRVSSIITREMAAEGYVETADDGTYRVALRGDRSAQRRRFSLAHELAHIIVHQLSNTKNALSRQYRACTTVSTALDDEAIADLIGGIILLPPSAMSAELPENFSIETIVGLASKADCSVAVSLIRSMWYATQPCIAFHIRVYDGDAKTAKCLWTRASRAVKGRDFRSFGETIRGDVLNEIIDGSCSRRFSRFQSSSPAVMSIETYRRRFQDRDFIYGFVTLQQTLGRLGTSARDLFVDHTGA